MSYLRKRSGSCSHAESCMTSEAPPPTSPLPFGRPLLTLITDSACGIERATRFVRKVVTCMASAPLLSCPCVCVCVYFVCHATYTMTRGAPSAAVRVSRRALALITQQWGKGRRVMKGGRCTRPFREFIASGDRRTVRVCTWLRWMIES